MKFIAFFTIFLGTAVADAVRSDCGSTDSASVFDELVSCNGDFSFSRQDGRMVLLHKPSKRKIWDSSAIDGAYFAFWDPQNQPIANGPASDFTQPLQANSPTQPIANAPDTQLQQANSADSDSTQLLQASLPALDMSNPFGETKTGNVLPSAGETQQSPSGDLLSTAILNPDGTLPVLSGTTPDVTQPIGATLPPLDGKGLLDDNSRVASSQGVIEKLPDTSNTGLFGSNEQISASPSGFNSETSLQNSESGTTTADVKARAILENTPYSNNYFGKLNLRLVLADDGNLEIHKLGIIQNEVQPNQNQGDQANQAKPDQSDQTQDQPDPNQDKAGSKVWSSNTKGVDCFPSITCGGPCPIQKFILDTEKGSLASLVESKGYSREASYIRNDICALAKAHWKELGYYEKKSDTSGLTNANSVALANDDSNDNSLALANVDSNDNLLALTNDNSNDDPKNELPTIAGRAIRYHKIRKTGRKTKTKPKVTSSQAKPFSPDNPPFFRCKTVVVASTLSASFYWTEHTNIYTPELIIGNARIEKMWCYDSFQVTNAKGDAEPDDAAVYGEPVGWAGWAGYIWAGQAPGSNVDEWSPETDQKNNVVGGKAKRLFTHVSKRQARFEWKWPFITPIYTTDQFFSSIMQVTAHADGSVGCLGGTCVQVPNPG